MPANAPHVEASPGPDNSSQLENQFEVSSNLLDLNGQHELESGTNQAVSKEVSAVAKGLTIAHESGNSYTAESAKEAIGVGCTFLGSVSLRHANLLFKLETIGQAKMAEKSERPIPNQKSENDHKPREKVAAPAKEQTVQKEPFLNVESVQTALTQSERVVTPPTGAELTRPTAESVADVSLEEVKISDLAATIALNRTNFLHAELSTELNHQGVIADSKPILAPRQSPKLAPSFRQVESGDSQLSVEPTETPRALVLEAIDWPESSEDDEPLAEQTLPILESFDLSDVEPSSGEAFLPLDSIAPAESVIYNSVDQAMVDDLSDLLRASDELPFGSANAESSVINDGEAIETASLLESVLPKAVQATLDSFLESAEPDQAFKVEELKAHIIEAIDQLRELTVAELAEPKKVAAIEQLLEERYRELLQALDITIDEAEFKRFIVQLKEALAEVSAEQDERAGLDEGTHEHKQNFGSIAQGLSDTLTQTLQNIKLARFIIQATMA